jgi:DNA-binding response OmpR family regulator
MNPTTILITDDEPNIRMMVRTALDSEGYEVREAANGREALDMLQQTPIDLMVLDLNMPVLDGMSVLEELKAATGITRPRVVVLTAHGSIATAVKATRLGAADFIEKPITPVELRQVIQSVLNEPELDRMAVAPELLNSYEQVLERIRRSLRSAEFSGAEALLMKAADRRIQHSAEYFNLLGVLYEAQRNWRLARKCYGKAVAADKQYAPAQTNIRRLYELHTFGRTAEPIALGDETQDALFAKLREAKK